MNNNITQESSENIEKMWESMLRMQDEIGTKAIKENLDIIENNLREVKQSSLEEMKTEDEELDLDLEELSPEVMEYAKRELGETDEVKCQTLQELRDMIYGNYYNFTLEKIFLTNNIHNTENKKKTFVFLE